MYIYPESLFNTLYIELKNSFGKCPSDKINVTNMHSFFLQDQTHYSLIFNL